MPLELVRSLADITAADWEQLARADADPLHLAVRLSVSEDVVAQKLADAYLRIICRCSKKNHPRKSEQAAMTPLLRRVDFLRSNFGVRLRA